MYEFDTLFYSKFRWQVLTSSHFVGCTIKFVRTFINRVHIYQSFNQIIIHIRYLLLPRSILEYLKQYMQATDNNKILNKKKKRFVIASLVLEGADASYKRETGK